MNELRKLKSIQKLINVKNKPTIYESITRSWKDVSDSMWKAFNEIFCLCAFPRNFEDVSSKLYFC